MEGGQEQSEEERREALRAYLPRFGFRERVNDDLDFLLKGGRFFELANNRGVTLKRERDLVHTAVRKKEKKLMKAPDRDYEKINPLREIIDILHI
jgi:hypothetical protein